MKNPECVAQYIFINTHITKLGKEKQKYSQHLRSPFLYYMVTSHPLYTGTVINIS